MVITFARATYRSYQPRRTSTCRYTVGTPWHSFPATSPSPVPAVNTPPSCSPEGGRWPAFSPRVAQRKGRERCATPRRSENVRESVFLFNRINGISNLIRTRDRYDSRPAEFSSLEPRDRVESCVFFFSTPGSHAPSGKHVNR